MFFSNFEFIYVLLLVIVLVRILLNNSNIATFVTLSLTSLLSFAFFDTFLAFFPLVLFFLRNYFLTFFAWLKTLFFKLKLSFFSGNQEQEKKNVLWMKGKEEGSETISPERVERALVNQAQERMERGQQEYNKVVNQTKSVPLSQEPTGIGSLTVSKPFESVDNSQYPPVRPFSNQEGTSRFEGSTAQDQLVPKDKPLGQSDYSPDNSPTLGARLRHNLGSPVEETLQKDLSLAWIASGLGVFTLLSTIKIPWIILKKLDYTQELIKKLTAKGWPKFLFSWVHHPDPGPVDGKPLFALMVGLLVGNIIVLYLLMKIIYLLS